MALDEHFKLVHRRRTYQTAGTLRRVFLAVLLFWPVALTAQQITHARAHSHNDYEQASPLDDALRYGFGSVEADIHLIDGELYVSHSRPEKAERSKTLRAMYLEPLKQRVKANHGRVYPDYPDQFYLMIDIKTDAAETSCVLDRQLAAYSSMISALQDTIDARNKAVKIFVSGNRGPTEAFPAAGYRFFALDGRPEDLGKRIPPALMPVVSQDYRQFFTWPGEGEVNPAELIRFRTFVAQAHAEGKKVRLWGEPDIPQLWKFLLDEGVDLINTNRIPELAAFLDSYR
jgi:hypothetical protein